MARPKNELEVDKITITINRVMSQDLDRIVQTGLFGIRDLIKEGVLPKRRES